MREAGPNHTGYVAGGSGAEDLANGVEGGLCLVAKATVALLIGDAVIVDTTTGQVTKSLTTGDHVRRCGIVVGGTRTGMKALAGSEAVGLAAAAIDEQVLVCYSGIAWAIAQTDSVAVGDALSLDTTTAGRVLDSAVATKNVGIALSASAAAADPVKVLVVLS
jgi:hypothetical protein